jgi:hypothetical protein
MDPIKDSLEQNLVLIISKSRASTWVQAKDILLTIDDVQSYKQNPDIYYFIVGRDIVRMIKAANLIELLGHTKSIQIYANGMLIKTDWFIKNILECYVKATKFNNYKEYCHVVHEFINNREARMSIRIDFEDDDSHSGKQTIIHKAIFPCRLLYQRMRYALGENYSGNTKVKVMGVENNFYLCPYFNHEDYLEAVPMMPD